MSVFVRENNISTYNVLTFVNKEENLALVGLGYVGMPIAVAFVSPFKLRKPEIIGMIMMALCGVAIFALVLIGVSV